MAFQPALNDWLPIAVAVRASVCGALPAVGPLVAALLLAACAPAAGGRPAVVATATAAPATSAPAAAPTSAPAAGPETIKYAAGTSVSSAGVFIGIDRGYYREVGLEIEIVPFSNAAEMIQPIAASQVDVANADTGAGIFNALARGLPLRFVADGNHTEPGHSSLAWVVRKDLVDSGAVRELPDLRGRKLSPIARGSLVDSLGYRTLARAGLQPSDVEIEYVTFTDVLPALANQALDAAILNEPLVTSAVEQGLGVRWRGMDDLFGTFQGTLIIYSPTMVTQRQDAGRRFMVGYLRSLRDYLDAFNGGKDLDAVLAILTKYTAIKDPAVYRKIVVPAFDANGQMNPQSIKDLQQWYVENGFVQTPVALDEFFDTSYLEHALGIVGRR
jgi:NitT/TauT family transport system substrate-binding protein